MKRLFLSILLLVTILIFFVINTYAENGFGEYAEYANWHFYLSDGNIVREQIAFGNTNTEIFWKGNFKGLYVSDDKLFAATENNSVISISLLDDSVRYFSDFGIFANQANYNSEQNNDDMLLGSLSAKYESNGNPGAISSGNDAGGVSFGAYQFASNAGVPLSFAKWCINSGKNLNTGTRLQTAYLNDGNTYGEYFKSEWRALAAEDYDGFLLLQHNYVKANYYDAIVTRVENNVDGFNMELYGIALKNVFWSRSVQHGVGGSYNVITRAFQNIGGFSCQSEEVLIRAIYAESGAVVDTGTNPMTGKTAEQYGIAGKYMKYYSKNSSAVQLSVYSRLNIRELSDALDMLNTYGGYIADSPKPTHTVTFLNYDNTPIGTVTVKDGDDAVYPFEIPEKSSDNQFDYTFSGWSGSVSDVHSDITVTALFTSTVRKYKVTFLDWNGSILKEYTVEYGSDVVYDGTLPTRESSTQSKYIFAGWSQSTDFITSDIEVKPIFEKKDILWGGEAAEKYSSGDGTVSSPYIITNAEELALLVIDAKNEKTNGKYYRLEDNIVLNSGLKNVGENTNVWTPIGDAEMPFCGIFDGNGYKIIGLYVKEQKYGGLFGFALNAQIKNVIVENSIIKDCDTAGIIVGVLQKTDRGASVSQLSACMSAGTLEGNGLCGGIAGKIVGGARVYDVHSTALMSGNLCGGLVGSLQGGELARGFFDGKIESNGNKTICNSIIQNAQAYGTYYSSRSALTDPTATAIEASELGKKESFPLLDFNSVWTIDETPRLSIIKNPDFGYLMYGDINEDGVVSIFDAVMLAQYLAKWEIDLSDSALEAADVNCDGVIDIKDAILLAQYLAKWDVVLG